MKKAISLLISVMLIFSCAVYCGTGVKAADTGFLDELRLAYASDYSGTPMISDLSYKEVGKAYEKYEITFSLSAEFKNPFDPDDISVDAVFTYPSGKKAVIPAFYIQEKNYKNSTTLMTYNNNAYTDVGNPYWCVRFSGDEIGEYRFNITVTDSKGETYISPERDFRLEMSDNKGYVKVSDFNKSYFVNSADGSLFYGSGSNIAWVRSQFTSDPEHLSYEYFLSKADEAQTTLSRVWLCHWAWLEWTPEETDTATYSYAGLGYYNQCISSALDSIITQCEDYGIRIILTLDDNNEHFSTDSTDYDGWYYNPYNTINGGAAENTEEYWSSEGVRESYKKRLRYIIARWGYSSSLMSINLWNDCSIPTEDIVDYLNELNSYAKELTENWRPLLFASNYRYEANDVLDYATQNFETSTADKPSVTQECFFTDDSEWFKDTLRSTLWDELFSGSGSALVWDHDAVDETQSWDVFTGILNFIKNVPLHLREYTDHYDISKLVTTWSNNGHTPTLSIEDGKLAVGCSTSALSYARINTENAPILEKGAGISFYYEAGAGYSDNTFRINLSFGDNAYMPWCGQPYYVTDLSGNTTEYTVSGSTQWSSWLKGVEKGTIFIPFSSFMIPDDYSATVVEEQYKGNIFEENAEDINLVFQHNSVKDEKFTVYLDDFCFVSGENSVLAQDFSTYKAESVTVNNSDEAGGLSYKIVQARDLGDVVSWKNKATENEFYVSSDSGDMLLSGISKLLYGKNADRVIYKNDPTFIIDAPLGGKIIIELSEIGSGKNILKVTKNGEEYSSFTYTDGRRELNDNEKYVVIDLEKGANEITLSNEGHDWISVVKYIFAFNSDNNSSVKVKRLIEANQQLTYIENSTYTEVYNKVLGAEPKDIEDIAVPFYDIDSGEYTLELYNPVTGESLSEETVNISGESYIYQIDKLEKSLAIKLTKNILYGDINGDGKVNLLDLVRLKKYLAEISVKVDEIAADITVDGVINAFDISSLRKKIINLN